MANSRLQHADEQGGWLIARTMSVRLYTIGHSRHSPEQLVHLLGICQISKLVDVRRVPFSRYCPQFNRDQLANDLSRRGIDYWHVEELGGLRHSDDSANSRHTSWRNPFLRSYADHALSKPFLDALDALCRAAVQETCAIMCAEADWRQCHRQIISDYLILRDFEVVHILPNGAFEPARLTPLASVTADGRLLYSKPTNHQLALDL
jgi:uncharacterized protein (DUF488 family)